MDQTFIATQAISSAIYPGRHLLVKGVSASRPVPEQILAYAKPYAGEVSDPFIFDLEAEAAELEAASQIFAMKPAEPVKRAEMRQLLGGVDDDTLNACMDRFRLPRAQLVHVYGEDLLNPIDHAEIWDRRAVEDWLREARRVLGPIVTPSTKASPVGRLRALVGERA